MLLNTLTYVTLGGQDVWHPGQLSVPNCIFMLCIMALPLRSMAGDVAEAWAKSAMIIVVVLL